jgi:hypothetical protein
MISILVALLVFCVIASVLLYVARLVISAVPIPQPFANIAYAIVVLIVLALFLSEIGWLGSAHAWRVWR